MAVVEMKEILELLPHRYPFLLLDRVTEMDTDGRRIVGLKNVTVNEPFFQGHFPGEPIMPGVMQLEAMAQTGGILMKKIGGDASGIPYFMSIDKVKFRKVVRPGDQMKIEVTITKLRSRSARFEGRIHVDDILVCEAEMMCMLANEEAS